MNGLVTIMFMVLVCDEPQAVIEYDPLTKTTKTYTEKEFNNPEDVGYLLERLDKDDVTMVVLKNEKGRCF